MIQWNHIGGGVLAAWPWQTNLATVSGSVAEGQLFWPCNDINLPPPAACDWLSVKKIRFSWSWDSPIGEFSGEEDVTAGVRLYRSDIFSDGELHELGDAVETFDAMIETRGRVSREEFPDGPDSTFPLWSGYFDELKMDDEDAYWLIARFNLGWPVPAARDGAPGWRLSADLGQQVELQGFFDEDFKGDPTLMGQSGGLTILGDDGGLIGEHQSSFDAELEVIEMW